MTIDKFIQQGHDKLILFFNGWSAPPALFHTLEVPADTDYWIVYDYRDATFQADWSPYVEVQVYAWSLGVWVASHVLPQQGRIPITKAVAINGTPSPISSTMGIPEVAFRATLRHLTPEGLHLFQQRICHSPANVAHYAAYPPRPLPAVAEELHSLYQQIRGEAAPADFPWSLAYVSSPEVGDAIFPIANQHRAWASQHVPIQHLQAPHCPFFQYPNLFAL